MLDTKEVFYEPVDGNPSVKYETLTYYRMSRDFFDSNATFLEFSPLTEDEISIHRPDLPLRLNCFTDIFWKSENIGTRSEFIEYLSSKCISELELESLNNSKVVVYPLSQQLSMKKPVILERDQHYPSGLDLMFSCFQIQQAYVKGEKTYFSRFRLIPGGREEKRLSGIGLYRLGIKGRLPSYYLGGTISLSELEGESSLIV